MGYAFISYSSKNQSAADALRDLLHDRGIDTWMAPGDIPIGSSYLKEINQALKNCSCLVLLLSNASIESKWVIKEVERVVNYSKPIIPLQIENVVLNDEFEFVLGSFQVVAVRKIDHDSEEIKSAIKSVIAATGTRENTSSPDFAASLQSSQDSELCIIQKRFPQYVNIIRLIEKNFGGIVYKGFDTDRKMEVAIKTYFHTDAFSTPLFTNSSLFWDLKRISSPNLCLIIERVLSEPTCIVMQYIKGQTLSNYLRDAYLVDYSAIKKILLGILNGLSALHQKNIFYGDLTPFNVIVNNRQEVWLCDFSESNYNDSPCPDKTILLDKYRSPERRMPGKRIDYRSDIYEFGIILTDCIMVPSNHDVRNDLFEIVQKCTKENPEDRFQSVNEIIDAIKSITV